MAASSSFKAISNHLLSSTCMRRKAPHMLAAGLLTIMPAGNALAAPVLDQIVHGDINVTSTTNTTTINQTTQQGIIHWQNFDIGAGERTHFNQPNASATTLNRVTGSQHPSQIHGTLSATGNIILVNPNGVHFGKHSTVDVNGLIASTTDITNQDFIGNNFSFTQSGNPNAEIINRGTITAKQGGLVALVAPGVENHGVIRADQGTIAMGAGEAATFDFYGDKLINFAVDGETAKGITNTGTVQASGGAVYMSAATATAVVDNVINTNGIVEASSAHMDGGVIVLGASTGGVNISGSVKATGTKGGTISVNGSNINVVSATLDSSGENGGGNITIGGNKRAGDADIATTTIIDTDSTLIADATQSGDGGNIIVWSEDATLFDGNLSARGARDGGFAEVSSTGLLGYYGLADLSGGTGENGLLLLDPDRVVIGTNTRDDAEIADGAVSSGDGSGTFQIAASAVEAALNAADVVIEAITSITVNENIDGYAAPVGNGLTLDAQTVRINNDITLNDAPLNLYGNTINVQGNIDTNGGHVFVRNVGGGDNVDRFIQGASSTITANRFNGRGGINTINAQGDFSLSGWLRTTINDSAVFGGDVTINGSRFDVTGGRVTVNNVTAKKVIITGAERITANGDLRSTGGENKGEFTLTSDGNVTLRGKATSDNDTMNITSTNGNVSIEGAASAGTDMTVSGNVVTLEDGATAGSALTITAATNLRLGNALHFATESVDTDRITILDSDANIQQGIDLVNEDGTVRVEAGTYGQGNINVNNSVTLIGAGKDQTLIDASGFNNALIFAADADGVSVSNLGVSGSNFATIRIDADDDVINDLTFNNISAQADNGSGIVVRDQTTLTNLRILNSMLNENAFSGLLVNGDSTINTLVVRNTNFDNNGFNGVRVDSGSTINTASFGTNANGQTTFSSNGANGAYIQGGSTITFDDVVMDGNTEHGLLATLAEGDVLSNVTVRNSAIENNESGLSFKAIGDAILSWVRAHDNTFGTNQPSQIAFDGDVNVRLSTGGAAKDLADQTERNEVIDDLIANNTFGTLVYVTDELDGDWVGEPTLWGNIQPAIGASSETNWINIAEGTYDENLLIQTDLNLVGLTEEKANVIIKPSDISDNGFEEFTTGNMIKPIIMAEHATITMQNLTIDGSDVKTGYEAGERATGIGLNNAGGTINNVAVSSIYDDATEQGTGIFAQGGIRLDRDRAAVVALDAGPVRGPGINELLIANSDISDVQYSGIHVDGLGLSAVILENTLTGNGKNANVAQTMIKLTSNVNGGVFGNTITNFGKKGSTGIHAEEVGFGAAFIEFLLDDFEDVKRDAADVVVAAFEDIPDPTYFIEGNMITADGSKKNTVGIRVDAGLAESEIPLDVACDCDDEVASIALLDNTISGGRTGISNKAGFVDIGDSSIDVKKVGIKDAGFATVIFETTVEGADSGLETTGVTDVYDSTFIDNKVGLFVEKGGDLFIGDTTVTGGNVGLRVKGKNSVVEFDDIADGSRFEGQSKFAIEFASKAMNDEELDVSTVFFDGTRGDAIGDAGEALVFDENDDERVGDVVFTEIETPTVPGGGGGGGGTGGGGGGDTTGGGDDDTPTGGGDDTTSGGDDTTGGGNDTTPGGGADTTDGGNDGSGSSGTGDGGNGGSGGDSTGGGNDGDTGSAISSGSLDELEKNRASGTPSLFSFFGETAGNAFNFSGTFADLSLLGNGANTTNYQGLSVSALAGLEPAAGGDSAGNTPEDDSCGNGFLSGGFRLSFNASDC